MTELCYTDITLTHPS